MRPCLRKSLCYLPKMVSFVNSSCRNKIIRLFKRLGYSNTKLISVDRIFTSPLLAQKGVGIVLPGASNDDSRFQRDHMVDESVLGYELEGGTNTLKRNAEKSNVWLGPRLGRRKRSEDDFSLISQDKNGGTLIEILQDAPWALVPLKGSPRRSTTFTPRLGRDSDEEYSDGTMEVVYGKAGPRTGNHATGTSFTPRLGRHATLFTHQHL